MQSMFSARFDTADAERVSGSKEEMGVDDQGVHRKKKN